MSLQAESTTPDPAFEFVRELARELAGGEFELPPFPDTALRVQRCMDDPSADVHAVAAVVAREPALAARLMRMANSALLRRGTMEITNLPTAISRVGMDMVLNAAVSFAAREAFRPPPGSACAEAIEALRGRSVRVAVIAFVISRRLKTVGKPEEAMLAGLLHGVGRFYVYTRAAAHPALFADGGALEALVQDWHSGVARAIVEAWGFPEAIAHAVCEQETDRRDRRGQPTIGDVLYVAMDVTSVLEDPDRDLANSDALARLRLDAADLAEILRDLDPVIRAMITNLGG